MENNSLKIFSNPIFGDIRTMMVENEPSFCLADVCKALELSNVSMVKSRLMEKGISTNDTLTNGGIQKIIFINEPNLYKCIFQSRKPEAEQFQDWVFKEVLPSIRKDGIFATDITIEKMLSDPDFAISLLTKLKEERESRIYAENKVAILTHTNKTYTATEVAKEFGFKSANSLNKFLHEKGIQFQQNGTWVPFSKYSQMGLFEIKQEVLDNGHIIYHRRITGIGREFISELIKK